MGATAPVAAPTITPPGALEVLRQNEESRPGGDRTGFHTHAALGGESRRDARPTGGSADAGCVAPCGANGVRELNDHVKPDMSLWPGKRKNAVAMRGMR